MLQSALMAHSHLSSYDEIQGHRDLCGCSGMAPADLGHISSVLGHVFDPQLKECRSGLRGSGLE